LTQTTKDVYAGLRVPPVPDPPVPASRASTAEGEPSERTCPRCGHRAQTTRERCPSCGTSLFAAPPRLSAARRRTMLWAGGALLLLVVAATVVLGYRISSDRSARDRAEAIRATAAEKVRLRRLQTPHRAAAAGLLPPPGASAAQRLAARARLVKVVEARITEDARARAARGEIDGPIKATSCGPFLRSPDAVPDDRVLSREVGRYDCVAIKADVRSGGKSVGSLGYAFVAALDFRRFSYVWCRNTPPQGERGSALAFVRLDRACLAAKGRALGTGYVDVPGS
jgi:ribosomal protein L37E